jgi:FkbM family methyltransferase
MMDIRLALKHFKYEAIQRFGPRFRKSYSQSGEDVIIDFIFKVRGIEKYSYLDIGAHDPLYISNTAYFYSKGCRGVNVEPNPVLIKKFKLYRPGDVNLNVGVSDKKGNLKFYVMDPYTLSTFSQVEAEKITKEKKFKILRTLDVPVVSYKDIVEEYFNNIAPDVLSVDVEGMDEVIIKSIDFKTQRPKVICLETIDSVEKDENKIHKKDQEIVAYLLAQGYFVYADTYINTIFVDKEFWKK